MFEELPVLGAGLGYHFDLHEDILANADGIDFLEIPTDQFLQQPPDWQERLDVLTRRFPVVAHGIYMSLGAAGGPHLEYLDRLAPYIDLLDPYWFSDHIDMGNLPDHDLAKYFHGIQVPFTRDQAAIFRQNMRTFRERIGRPLLVENIFYHYVVPMPGSLPEPVFISEVLRGTDSGLLLDVTNMYLNSLNLGFDAYAWLDQAPLEHTVEIHVAGGEQIRSGPRKGRWADTHTRPVPDEVWRMVEYVVARGPVKAILLERDGDFPPFSEILAELSIARAILASAGRHPSAAVSLHAAPAMVEP